MPQMTGALNLQEERQWQRTSGEASLNSSCRSTGERLSALRNGGRKMEDCCCLYQPVAPSQRSLTVRIANPLCNPVRKAKVCISYPLHPNGTVEPVANIHDSATFVVGNVVHHGRKNRPDATGMVRPPTNTKSGTLSVAVENEDRTWILLGLLISIPCSNTIGELPATTPCRTR